MCTFGGGWFGNSATASAAKKLSAPSICYSEERGAGWLTQIQAVQPDLVVLNLTHADQADLTRCTQLRRCSLAPLVAWTTAWRPDQVIAALEQGADDVSDATMPFPVVASRLHAVLRRQRWLRNLGEVDSVQVGEILLDDRQHAVFVRGPPSAVDGDSVLPALLSDAACPSLCAA
jgi:DNA-binding response OmpR family regulator